MLIIDIMLLADVDLTVVIVYMPTQFVSEQELDALLLKSKFVIIVSDFNRKHKESKLISWNSIPEMFFR